MNRVACLLVVQVALLGCSNEPVGQEAAVRTSMMEAPLSLVPLSEIGCSSCNGPEQLSVRSVTTDGDNRVYVLDRFEPFVRVFDAGGTLVGSFGRFGDGPGELQNPGYVYAAGAGQLYVMDRRARRLVLYADDGEKRGEWLLPHFPYALVYEPRSDTFLFASPHEANVRGESAVFEFDPKTGVVRRVASFIDSFPVNAEGKLAIDYPLAVNARHAIGVGEYSERYRVRIYDADGELAREHSLDVAREPKTADELELERTRIARERIALDIDDRKLHYYAWALNFDSEGRLWVRAGRSDRQRTIFDVFVREGYLGSVLAPGGIMERDPYVIRGTYLVATFLDEGEEYIVRVFKIDSRA